MSFCTGFTITNTGVTFETISYTSCVDSFCQIDLEIGPGESYYINTASLIFFNPNLVTSDVQTGFLFIYNFSSECNNTVFSIGKGSLPSLNIGDTYCLSSFSCEEKVIFSGCYTLIGVGNSGFTQTDWISIPSYSGDSAGCLLSCPCSPASPCLNDYCITNTHTSYDGIYSYAGTYNGDNYWSGDTSPTYYIFNNGDEWCLSDSLGGICLLSGKFPCISQCPDLCDTFFGIGPCLTTTTTTSPCNDFDFDALFNCNVEPTPSPTVTPTVTPTITVTPSSTNFCSMVNVDATILSFTPTPSPTPTLTPTSTPEITRPCSFSGDVRFMVIEGEIDCPRSLQFQDCLNGMMYYTTKSVSNPSGGEITQFMIFKSEVDGISRCISYIGINNDVIGVNNISLVEGPIGFSNLGECILCVPDISPTPTPTVTPTVTPTITLTPTPSLKEQYYVYRQCRSIGIDDSGPYYKYIIQTSPGPTTNVGEVVNNIEQIGSKIITVCWEFMYISTLFPIIPPPNQYTTYSGNWFTPATPAVYNNCHDCQLANTIVG